ncbi:MAG: PEP-CTERM sorting domain-containing protein [Halioglobus sp.]|nr:PEP-CTERM sorting domain-containing protein [Halioglobus sp.]
MIKDAYLATKTPMKGLRLFATAATCVLSLGFVNAVQAAPITGDPQSNTFNWTPNSTNALNYAQQTPGRVGQLAPYVIFNSTGFGSVTLDFSNLANGLAFFETRIDDIATGATSHPVVSGDTIHTGGTSVASGTALFQKTFFATSYVDIRLALGAERDWDFDWVRFEVPVPGTLALFSLGLVGLAFRRRRN